MLETYLLLESIVKTYEEIVLETKILKLPSGEASKLRIELVDGSFADVWISRSHYSRRGCIPCPLCNQTGGGHSGELDLHPVGHHLTRTGRLRAV